MSAAAFTAGGALSLTAKRDITLAANQTGSHYRGSTARGDTVRQQGSILSAGTDLTLAAGRDIAGQTAEMAAEQDITLAAGRDISLTAAADSDSHRYSTRNKTEASATVRQQGTAILSGGRTTLLAARDITASAAAVTAGRDITLSAGRDLSLGTATESDYHYREESKTSGGFLSKKRTHTIEEHHATTEKGSLLSGSNLSLSAANNLDVTGSAVAGDGTVSLTAGNNLSIVAVTETQSAYRLEEKKKSGLFSGSGAGITLGSAASRHEVNEAGTTQSQSVSTLGSTGSSVPLSAGKLAHIGGADVVAGKDLTISADSVQIDPGKDLRRRDERLEQKQSGLTLALAGTAGSG